MADLAQPPITSSEHPAALPQGTPRRAGRPPRKVLTRDLITRSTLELLESAGHERFTMAALARTLEVAPSALYNHVESKKDVLLWVQDHLMSLVDAGAFEHRPWNEALREWAWSYRDIFALHAPLIPIIAVMPVGDAPDTLRMYEQVARGLISGGWPPEQVVPGIVAIESFIYGSALDVSAPEDIFDSGSLAGQFPTFTAAVASSRPPGPHESRADTAFESGLTAMISGLRDQLAVRE